jgi:hypothetical protein
MFLFEWIMNSPFWTGAINPSMTYVGLYGRNGAVIFLRERTARINSKKEVIYYVIFSVGNKMANNIWIKNCVFWDVMPCDSCKDRRFGGT